MESEKSAYGLLALLACMLLACGDSRTVRGRRELHGGVDAAVGAPPDAAAPSPDGGGVASTPSPDGGGEMDGGAVDGGLVDGGVPEFERFTKDFELSRDGDRVSFAIAGRRGQRIAFLVQTLSGPDAAVSLYSPDDNEAAYLEVLSSVERGLDYRADGMRLSETGNYVFEIEPRGVDLEFDYVPPADVSGKYRFEAWNVPEDVEADLVIDGEMTSARNVEPAQNVAFKFYANGGERVSFGLTSSIEARIAALVSPGDSASSVPLIPDSATWGYQDVYELPEEAGTYRLVVSPFGLSLGTVGVEAWTVADDVVQPVTIDGDEASIKTVDRNQNGTFTFGAHGAERMAAAVTSNLTEEAFFTLRSPSQWIDGRWVAANGTTFIDAFVLPDEAGTYTWEVDPKGLVKGTISMTLWSVPDDASTGIVVGEGASMINIATAGQNGAFTFEVTQGQRLSYTVTNGTNLDASIKLISPDGNDETDLSSVSTQGTASSQVVTFAETGTYRLEIDPSGQAMGTITASVDAE